MDPHNVNELNILTDSEDADYVRNIKSGTA